MVIESMMSPLTRVAVLRSLLPLLFLPHTRFSFFLVFTTTSAQLAMQNERSMFTYQPYPIVGAASVVASATVAAAAAAAAVVVAAVAPGAAVASVPAVRALFLPPSMARQYKQNARLRT
jgi:hypothetical protein